MQPIYLDHNSTTPILPAVADAMHEVLRAGYVNPASQHQLGQRARRLLEETREAIIALLGGKTSGMDADRLIFTSGGTEANNLAIRGLAGKPPGRIIISSVEHPSVLGPAEYLATQGFVVDRIGGEGNVVMFVFDAFPPVQIRGAKADEIFAANAGITVLDRITPDVSDGGIADSRAKMDAVLAANPEPGSIKAVWAAWDQPALGALQAIEAAGRQGEGIVITGIDANPQAREEVAKGGNFEATVAQDFAGIGAAAAEAVAGLLAGNAPADAVTFVPTKLVTKENAAQ